MKKIRFIKDIPELEVMADRASRFEVCFTCSQTSSGGYKYDSDTYSFISFCSPRFLVGHGYAEWVEKEGVEEVEVLKEVDTMLALELYNYAQRDDISDERFNGYKEAMLTASDIVKGKIEESS
jgi:hypothetical protein